MKIVVIGFAVVFLIIGGVWTGQGAGFIGGSFMTGQKTWLVIGLICMCSGMILLAWARSGRHPDRSDDVE